MLSVAYANKRKNLFDIFLANVVQLKEFGLNYYQVHTL